LKIISLFKLFDVLEITKKTIDQIYKGVKTAVIEDDFTLFEESCED